MLSGKKYSNKIDLKKFDTFIQDSLNKYFYVDPWDELYTNTGDNSYSIISNKSIIPDLVIYNKVFNKSDCFFNSAKNNKYIKFPREQFILKPKKLKNYNPTNAYLGEKNDQIESQKILEPFEFKSIPKEIEDKYTHNDIKNISDNNNLLDELNDFFRNDKNNSTQIKINLLQENENKEPAHDNKQKNENEKNNQTNDNDKENKENKNKNRKYSNNENYHKNKFEIPINISNMPINYNNNLNYINYYKNLNYQKIIQNIQFQNHVNKVLGNINNIKNNLNNLNNNNQKNKFNFPVIDKKEEVNNNNSNTNQNVNNNILTDFKHEDNKNKNNNNNINPISYYNNTDESDMIEKYINNMDIIFNKNKNKRDWKVVDIRNNFIVYKFNNEQLFYFLSTIINRNEDKFYSVSDLESDILFNPIEIYEDLKKICQK